jgi:hypothetical protein
LLSEVARVPPRQQCCVARHRARCLRSLVGAL